MACPKCKAKIGTVRQEFATESGRALGILCYMCGCWIQGYPHHDARPLRPQEMTGMAS